MVETMNYLNDIVQTLSTFLWGNILIIPLIVLGIYFSFRSGFVQFTYFKEMIALLGDGIGKSVNKSGGISSFQAFCISTASRVGTGNISGVAIAIVLGGPGAVFWMWLIALLGAASSFVESTLAQIYKEKDEVGFRGGPAYYMEKGLGMRWLGIIFAGLITITFGLIFNAVQANTITAAFSNAFGMNKALLGIIISIVTAFIIFGGIERIAKASEVIVPIFATLYILVALLVIILNIKEVPSVFSLIFQNAFGLREMGVGGIMGTIMHGVKRGLFSNEAGMGSAPNAAATATVSHPVKQGLIQAFGVFVDTIIICTCTAFIILLAGDYTNTNLTGIELTQAALTSQFGNFGSYFVALCIVLFAFSSIIGNYYYGQSNIEFIKYNKTFMLIYRISVVAMVMLGSLLKVSVVWDLADVFMGFMAIINLIAIALLNREAIACLKDYKRQRKEGVKVPIFKASCIPSLKGKTSEWE